MTSTPKFSRRALLKKTAILGAATLASPLYVKSALASSGQLNLLLWEDYLPPEFLQGFYSETGIKVNYSGIGSNDEIINNMIVSQGQGFDLISPSNFTSLQWSGLDLLQPFDLGRVKLDAVQPAMAKIGSEHWNFNNKGSHWLPHIWGTEGIAYRHDIWNPLNGETSYGDIWAEENAGKTMGRAHSAMLGAGLYLEATLQMAPGSIWRSYENEDNMRLVWEEITHWCIERKAILKVLWNDAQTQKDALMTEGVVVGQTWDGPPLSLKTAGLPVNYRAPIEGALAWIDGLALPIGAKNIDQIYAFIEYAYSAKHAGKAIDGHGYNSPVIGANSYAGDAYKKNFDDAYPGNSLSNLNPWPSEPTWYVNIRSEYANQFRRA